jgi:tetrahydromethanopterin S-methyltransferase subunit B
MNDRITEKNLQAVVDRINSATGSPMQPWDKLPGQDRMQAQIGCYHLSHAYGGVCLHRGLSI